MALKAAQGDRMSWKYPVHPIKVFTLQGVVWLEEKVSQSDGGCTHIQPVPQRMGSVQLLDSRETHRILAEAGKTLGQSDLRSTNDFPGDLMATWCEFKISAKQNTNLGAGGGRGGKQKAEATGSRLWRQTKLPNKSLLASANFQLRDEEGESCSSEKQGWGQGRSMHEKRQPRQVLLGRQLQLSNEKVCWG